MCEVTLNNFKEKFDEICESLKIAKFISVDLEYSALYPLKNEQPSLFDTPSERYTKVRKNIEQIIPVQVGLTAFTFNPHQNAYSGKLFTFYVIPASFQNSGKSFYFNSTTLTFLKIFDFDFNKFAYAGVPFINKYDEATIRQKINTNSIYPNQSNSISTIESIECEEGEILRKWYAKGKSGDKLTLSSIKKKCKNDPEILYFVHKNFRRRFKNLWTCINNGDFHVEILTDDQYKIVSKLNDMEETLMDNLLGFSKIFRILVSLQKPIIGHNLFQDILVMINSFEQPLPHSYSEFKKLTMQLLPMIFDTKVLTYELKDLIPEEKRWINTGLDTLFEYFKNGTGRHLVNNSPAIDIESSQNNHGQFHEAGWDSFCTGYIFIRLAHLNVCKNFPISKTFVPSELIGGLKHLKNYLNVIRGSTSSIKLDGEDPLSTRPPYLIVESIRNKPIDIAQITSILSDFGFVEVRKIRAHSKRALIAVDNFGNARRILNNFHKVNKDFQVQQYNALKHSPAVRVLLIGSLTFSGALLFWSLVRNNSK